MWEMYVRGGDEEEEGGKKEYRITIREQSILFEDQYPNEQTRNRL